MSMPLGAGQHMAALGGPNSAAKIDKHGPVSPIGGIGKQPPHVRTAGSIFGAMTHKSGGRRGGPRLPMPPGMSGGAGGMGGPKPPMPPGLPRGPQGAAGKFGALTLARPNPSAAANMNRAMINAQETNKDQSAIQTTDEMMEIANNLTMKDMWAAA